MQPLFPREVTSHVPRITWTGSDSLHVEQHQGVVAYCPEEVRLRTHLGMLTVTGKELSFLRYTAGEAMLTGQIETVALRREGGRR